MAGCLFLNTGRVIEGAGSGWKSRSIQIRGTASLGLYPKRVNASRARGLVTPRKGPRGRGWTFADQRAAKAQPPVDSKVEMQTRDGEQLDFFSASPTLPEGFRYQPELISREAEQALLAQFSDLPLKDFEFHGYVGKRRTVSFGSSYDFGREELQTADALPAFLLNLREAAAAFARLPAVDLKQALIIEYGAGAGIGWHRDKEVFGNVVGISLLSSCRFRLRRKKDGKWERVTIDAEPRSAYLLSGPARTEWEHSIPPVDIPRYSVTFRSIR
jgi:alkylated DNA repair dioxygenase AlkB